MRVSKLTAADYRRMPWKNGGGTTTEIIAEPAADGSFLWRVSIAEVAQSGPFSDFSGYDRTIMLLEGRGFELAFDPAAGAPARRIKKPLEPFRFPGEWQTQCTLIGGPVRDFNLIAARNGPTAVLEVVQLAPGAAKLAAAPTTLLHLVEGAAAIEGQALVAGETLRFDAAPRALGLGAAAPAVAVVIRIGDTVEAR